MLSVTTDRFRKAFARLPESIKNKARHSYSQWQTDPYHPSLGFKQVYSEKGNIFGANWTILSRLGLERGRYYDLVLDRVSWRL